MIERREHNDTEDVSEILGGLKCPKDFICYTAGQERLCKAEDIGLESFLVCLEKNAAECKFSVVFGDMNFCQCPLRIYIFRKLNK